MTEQNELLRPLEKGNNPQKKDKKNKSGRRIIAGVMAGFIAVIVISGLGFTSKVKELHDRGPLMMMLDKVTKNLDLTDQQKADIQKIRDEVKAKMEEKRSKRKADFSEFEQMFRGEKLEKSKLLELEAKHEADRKEMKEFFMDELIKFHSILTPEQRNKVADKMKEFREKKDNFRGKHERKGPDNY